MFDDRLGPRPEGLTLTVDPFARPKCSGFAQRLLDIEQELVLRDRAAVDVHIGNMLAMFGPTPLV